MVYSSSGEPLHSYSNGDSKVKMFLCASMIFYVSIIFYVFLKGWNISWNRHGILQQSAMLWTCETQTTQYDFRLFSSATKTQLRAKLRAMEVTVSQGHG